MQGAGDQCWSVLTTGMLVQSSKRCCKHSDCSNRCCVVLGDHRKDVPSIIDLGQLGLMCVLPLCDLRTCIRACNTLMICCWGLFGRLFPSATFESQAWPHGQYRG
jgi:hypothetical protein